MRASSHQRDSRGAALLTAMIIVALVATLASSMLWQQWRSVQVEAAERARTQAGWILAGALDWARLILREDARSDQNTGKSVDHLGEPWAVPLAESRLSTFLAADAQNTDDAPEAFLSGAISDAQARFNLSDLVNGGAIDANALAALQRLCTTVGVSSDVAAQIANGMRDASPVQPSDAAASAASAASSPASAAATGPVLAASAPASAVVAANAGKSGSADAPVDPPLLPLSVDQLAWFGVDAESLRTLEPYVTILPTKTAVNVNTASREVLVAAIDGLDLASAERMVQTRQRTPFNTRADALALAPASAASSANIDVRSDFFVVRGRLRLGDAVLEQRSLLQRRGLLVDVLHRERVSSRDPGGS